MTNATRAAKGGAATLAGQWGKYALQIVSLIVLARLLDPSDFGQFTMVMAVAGLAFVVGDSGLSLAAVQVSHLSQSEKSNLFWINTMVGAGSGLALYLLAPVVASLYGDTRLEDLCRAISVTFLFSGMAIQFRVELNRKWRFQSLALVDVIAQLGALVAAVLFAMSGAGAYALIAQQVCAAFLTLATAGIITRWRPSLPSRSAPVGGLLRFGGNTLATQLVTYVSSNVDSIAIGRASGAEALGVYSRAFQVFMLPLQQLASPMTRVALPLLVAAGDDKTLLIYLRRAQMILAYVLVGTLAALAAAAAPTLELLLGKGWEGGAPILQLLVIGGVFQALGYVYYWVFLAKARMGVLFWSELAGRCVMIGLILVVAPRGPEWVAAAHSFGLMVVWAGTTIVGMRVLRLRFGPVLAVAIRPVSIWAAAYLLSSVLLDTVLTGAPPVSQLLAVVGTFGLTLAVSALVPGVRRDLRAVFDVLVRVIKR